MRPLFLALMICTAGMPSFAQLSLPNNSFLLEEGWRADSAVNQHAIAYGDRQWSYTWTQEFAAPERSHRFAWSASVQASDSGPAEPGDLSLDYVWQWRGTDADRVAVAPRLSFVTPLQRGEGRSAVVVTSLPLSMRHGARAATHWNVRAAWTTGTEAIEIAIAAGVVRLVGEGMAAVVETEFRPLDGEVTISGGARWNAARFTGAGLVPGIAVPMTISKDDRSVSVLFHVMFEHQLSRSRE